MSKTDLVWLEPQSPEEIIDELINKYDKDKFYVLLSGGRDSFSVLHYITTNYPNLFASAVFTNTGISSSMTRKFTVDYCKEMNWKLEMTWARRSYYDIVMEHGFPNPASHRVIMGYLKFHSWYYYLQAKIKGGEKAAFISGVRKKESSVRNKQRFYTKKPMDHYGKVVFSKPFLYKNGEQLVEYHIKNGLKKTPAYDYFDKSGECWCGCFYNEWELKMIETHDPILFDQIKWLEKELQLHGTKEAKKFPHWGRSVGANISEQQTTFDSIDINEDYCGESCNVN